MMTRRHLEMIAATLREQDAPDAMVYAFADALANAKGTLVTSVFDRQRFLAAALTERDVVHVTYAPDDTVASTAFAVSATVLSDIDPGDARPIYAKNGNVVGSISRTCAPAEVGA